MVLDSGADATRKWIVIAMLVIKIKVVNELLPLVFEFDSRIGLCQVNIIMVVY